MKPIRFPWANKVLLRPANMADDECGSLPIFNDGRYCLSCWKATLRERIQFLFRGKIWLWVQGGQTQPPVCLEIRNPSFKKEAGVAGKEGET